MKDPIRYAPVTSNTESMGFSSSRRVVMIASPLMWLRVTGLSNAGIVTSVDLPPNVTNPFLTSMPGGMNLLPNALEGPQFTIMALLGKTHVDTRLAVNIMLLSGNANETGKRQINVCCSRWLQKKTRSLETYLAPSCWANRAMYGV